MRPTLTFVLVFQPPLSPAKKTAHDDDRYTAEGRLSDYLVKLVMTEIESTYVTIQFDRQLCGRMCNVVFAKSAQIRSW